MSVGERLNELYNYFLSTKIINSKQEFCHLFGIDKRNFSKYISNSVGFSIDTQNCDNFIKQRVSVYWLLTGEGQMFQDGSLESITDTIPLRKHESEGPEISTTAGVPFYDIDVAAHVTEMLADPQVQPDFYVDFKPFNDCTAYLPTYGDSMFPAIQSGDIIAIKQVNNLDVLLWGEPYVIITDANANNLRTVKLVFPHDDKSKIVLRASNPNFKGDTVINKADILYMYIVKGIVTRKQL